MRKKTWILVAIILLIVLIVPIPRGTCNDGGTQEYQALTYKLVSWARNTEDGIYRSTKLYFGEDAYRSVEELWIPESENLEQKFIATIIELGENNAIVEPCVGQWERNSSDRISFGIKDLEEIDVQVGSVVEVTYKGGIMESYPAQIRAVSWAVSPDLSHLPYTDIWLDKESMDPYKYDPTSEVIITAIYSDCFFARPVIPMPYTLKINGSVGDAWCVGDQVSCTYDNVYYDEDAGRLEADLLTIAVSTFQMEDIVYYKPVIYLYPEQETKVSVDLQLAGKFICTYPSYENGWKVTAFPDGTLKDGNGQTYNYLYWEGRVNANFDMTKGFCVKGEDTAAFLEQALEKLGLNRREANEFIVFWLPLMEQNPYNIISFQRDSYTEAAKLQVTPTPDTLIRVFMTWQASQTYVELTPQKLTAPQRKGFTVIEWGGTEIK